MRILIAIIAASLLAIGCGNHDPEGAQSAWRQLQGQGYKDWKTAPDYDTPQPTVGAHGESARVYINGVVAGVLDADESLDAWPVGSIIVKDSFDDDGALYRVAMMEKRSEGWYWAEWNDKGDVLYSGSPSVCTSCHDGGDDFVIAVELP